MKRLKVLLLALAIPVLMFCQTSHKHRGGVKIASETVVDSLSESVVDDSVRMYITGPSSVQKTFNLTAFGTGGGSGSVTSVGLSLPPQFTISGSPVTSTGTLTGVWADTAQNFIFAGPASGGAGKPNFRALVAGDLPSHNQAWSTITSTPTTLSGYGISDTEANFNTALSDGSFAFDGGAHHDGFSDFVGNEHTDHSSVSISTQHSLTGGGDLTTTRTLNLVNDAASPGNSKLYGTDGAGVKGWFDQPAGLGTHNILSSDHGDAETASAVRGDILTAQTATPEWRALAISTDVSNVLRTDGTDVYWGDLDFADLGTTPTTLAGYGITDAESPLTFTSGLTRTVDDVDLGGTLDAATTITGTNVNTFKVQTAQTSTGSASISVNGTNSLIRAYPTDDYSGTSFGEAFIDDDEVRLVVDEGTPQRSIHITSTSMYITDSDDTKGFVYAADYRDAGVNDNRWIPDWAAVADTATTQIGGKDLNSTITSPGASQDGDVVAWDDGASEYTSQDVVDIEDAAGVWVSLIDTLLYTNTSQTTIKQLPVGAVLQTVDVYIATAFTGTGTDLLDIGITGTGNRYEDDLDISTGAGDFATLTLENIKDRMSGSTNITYQYFDQNSNAGAGEAYIYIHYIIY